MNVKIWQICCFLAIIIGATIAVFPSRKSMLVYLIDSGRYRQASEAIRAMLDDTPRDGELVMQAVRLDLLEGSPQRAARRLTDLGREVSLDAAQLDQLARLYEWQRQPDRAQAAWEALLEKDPGNPSALRRLIGYYRYRGDVVRESIAIARLVSRLRDSGEWEPGGRRLIDLIGEELERIGRRGENAITDPVSAMLMEGLFQIYENSREGVDTEPWTASAATSARVVRCLEQFVWAGQLMAAVAFSERVDRLRDSGIDQRMLLVDVLRWNQMNREALDLLSRLDDEVPGDRRVLTVMRDVASVLGDGPAGIRALEALLEIAPDDSTNWQQLMSRYRQAGQMAPVFDHYRKRFDKHPDASLVPLLMTIAMESGDDALREEALTLSERVSSADPDILERQAELWLALNRPEKAYPLLKQLSTVPCGSTGNILTLIRVAGYTDDPKIMTDALTAAEPCSTGNPELLETIAGAWLAAARPEKAYVARRQLASVRENPAHDILEAMNMAGQTGNPVLIRQAVAWAVALAPKDPLIVEKGISLQLASGDAERAYRLKAEWVKRRQQATEVPALIALAEATGRADLLADALQIGVALMPADADLVLRTARLHLAQGRQRQAIAAFERYMTYRPGDIDAQCRLADLYEWQHQPREALDIYRRLALAHPDERRFSDALSRLLAATGDQEGLLGLLMQQADAHPEDADRSLTAGRALVAEGRLAAAQVYLERAAVAQPQRTAVWQDLANLYQWTGRQEKLITALEHLARAGQLDAQQSVTLAEAYLQRQRGADALALLKANEKRDPLPRRAGLMLAEAYESVRQHTAGRRIYERLFQENREDPEFLADIGDHALWRDHADLAKDIYTTVLRQAPRNLQALKGSGQIHARNDEPLQAIRMLEAYTRLDVDDYEAQYLLGEMYLAVHRDADARRQYRKAMKLIHAGKTTARETPHP